MCRPAVCDTSTRQQWHKPLAWKRTDATAAPIELQHLNIVGTCVDTFLCGSLGCAGVLYHLWFKGTSYSFTPAQHPSKEQNFVLDRKQHDYTLSFCSTSRDNKPH